MDHALQSYIFKNLKLLRKRDFILELFTDCESSMLPEVDKEQIYKTRGDFYIGKLLLGPKSELYTVTEFHKVSDGIYQITGYEPTGIFKKEKGSPLTYDIDVIDLPPGVVENHLSGTIKTTIGRLILNYILLAYPFGNVFPYVNRQFDPGYLESIVLEATVSEKVTTEQLSEFMKGLFFIGHMTEISVPNYTRKSLTTSPEVTRKRDELVKKHKSELDAGNSVIMAEIEAELIALDKTYIKGDDSEIFYNQNPGKAFSVQRKKTLSAGGMVEVFGSPGRFKFMETSFGEGVRTEDMVLVFNEIRAASYSRAMETEKGGVVAKQLSRALQNAKIVEDDCNTKRTMPIVVRPDTVNLYRNRWVYSQGRLVETTEDFLSANIGTTLSLRDPMTCESKGGYCQVCMGTLFKTLNQKNLVMRALTLSAFLLTLSLKRSHGVSFSTADAHQLNKYAF